MIEQQPAFGRFNGDWSCSNLRALPTTFCPHHEAMLTPMNQIWTLAQVNITERRMTIIAGTVEHNVLVLDFSGKQDAIPVERQKGILQKSEFLKIKGVSDP